MAVMEDMPNWNQLWKGWKGDPEKGIPEVQDMRAILDGNETISCWRLTQEELDRVNETGLVYLHIVGQQPPACVQAFGPDVRVSK